MKAHTLRLASGIFLKRVFKDSILWSSLLILVTAALISLALFNGAKSANETRYERWPLQGDTISYWSRDIALSKQPVSGVESPSRLTQAWNAAKQNGKDPIRTVFFGVLPEDAASSMNGHLVFSAGSAFLFLLMLMITLRRRTGSLAYAMAASFVALLPAELFSPMYGLPSKLPDLAASFLLGSAIFALFAGRGSRKSELSWIFIAGLLLGLATLARFQLWMYGLFILGPVAFIFGLRSYFNAGRQLKDLLIYPAILIVGLGIVAGNFILAWTEDMLAFYAIAGYGLNATILTSLKTTGAQFLQYLGIPAALAGTMIFAAYISLRNDKWEKRDLWDVLTTVWALVAYPILLFFIMRVESIIEQTYYIIPGLMLFLLSPFVRKREVQATGFKVFSLCLILILPLAAFGKIYGYLQSDSFIYPRERDVEVAKFQHVLADQVAVNIPVVGTASRPSTIDSNFFYYSRFIELAARSKFNRDAKSMMVFQIRQSQWQLSHTGDLVKDKALIMKALADKVDVFMALTKPLPEAKMETFVDDYTEQLALHVNSELAANPDVWENKGTVAGPYGEVTVYKNRLLK